MNGPLATLDKLFSPILIAANKARQARDSLPLWMWEAVPDVIQKPVDEIFAAVEAYDRFVGALADREAAELLPPKPG